MAYLEHHHPAMPAIEGAASDYDAPEEKQDTFVINSSGISAYDNSWSKQIPLIVSEGNFARPS